MDRPERVVVLLARLVLEDDAARHDVDRLEADELCDRRRRDQSRRDAVQELETRQLLG